MQTLAALAGALLMYSSVVMGQITGNLDDPCLLLDTPDEDALMHLMEDLISTGRAEEALALFEQNGSELTPNLLYRLAQIYERDGSHEQAELAILCAVEESTTEGERKSSYQALATFLWRQGRFGDALEKFEESRYSFKF